MENMDKAELKHQIAEFIEQEARSCSMEAITPLYIYRMWGGRVSMEDIVAAMEDKTTSISQ